MWREEIRKTSSKSKGWKTEKNDTLRDQTCEENLGNITPNQRSDSKNAETIRHTSDGNNITLILIDFHDIRAKREAFLNLDESMRTDVILACEAWLQSTKSNQEIL